MSDPITRDSLQIARLEEQVRTINRDMQTQTLQLQAMQKQLSEVLDALNRASGGWKTLMWLGGAAATVGGAVSWVLDHVVLK